MWLLSTTAMLILQLLWPSVGHSLYKTILFMIQTWSSYRCPRAGDLTASVREHLSGARLPWRQQRWRLSIHQTWEPCPLSERRIQCGISIADNGQRDKLTENWKWILKCKWWAFYFFLGIVTNAMPSEEMFNMWGDSPCPASTSPASTSPASTCPASTTWWAQLARSGTYTSQCPGLGLALCSLDCGHFYERCWTCLAFN